MHIRTYWPAARSTVSFWVLLGLTSTSSSTSLTTAPSSSTTSSSVFTGSSSGARSVLNTTNWWASLPLLVTSNVVLPAGTSAGDGATLYSCTVPLTVVPPPLSSAPQAPSTSTPAAPTTPTRTHDARIEADPSGAAPERRGSATRRRWGRPPAARRDGRTRPAPPPGGPSRPGRCPGWPTAAGRLRPRGRGSTAPSRPRTGPG